MKFSEVPDRSEIKFGVNIGWRMFGKFCFGGCMFELKDDEEVEVISRCENCIFWNNKENIGTDIDGDGIDNVTGICENKNLCDNDYNDDYFREKSKNDMLIYEYSEGGKIFTGKDFCCMHFRKVKK